MNVESIVEIAVENLNRIGIPEEYIRINTAPRNDGFPYIEETGNGQFRYAFSDGTAAHDERITKNIGDILFWIYSDITLRYACDWIRKNRLNCQNYRMGLISKQLDLLEGIKPEYAERKKKKYRRIFDEICMESGSHPNG